MRALRFTSRVVADSLFSLRAGPGRAPIRLGAWLVPFAAGACVVLAAVGIARRGNPARYFGDFRWGTLLSAGLLMLAAIGAARNWKALRGVFVSKAWLALGIGLGTAAVDDALGLHERVDFAINAMLGWDAAGDGDFIDDAIIPLYGLIVGAFFVAFGARCFARQPALVWCWGAAGAFFAVMVALDFIDRFQVVEESCKVLAASLIYSGVRSVRHDPLYRRLALRAGAERARRACERSGVPDWTARGSLGISRGG